MNVVVADTSPFNYLLQTGCVAVLPRLFSCVLIPPEVAAELADPGAPEGVRGWMAAPPAWLEVRAPRIRLDLPADPGEVAALSLAVEAGATEILLDDRLGRELARGLGLRPVGTLRVLELAGERGLLDLPAVLERLRATRFRIHPDLVADVLRRWDERRR